MLAVIIGAITVTVLVALTTKGYSDEIVTPTSKDGCATWALIIGLFVVGAFVMALARMH